MNINLHNYEAYFLDYHEGNLSLNLVKELMEFVEKHPQLRGEFESFEPVTLSDSTPIEYDEKASLKKQHKGINASNFDEYAIECVEGILPAALQQELKAFIAKNPSYQKELELYSKTKISADTNIVFESKASLKRGKKRPAGFYYWSAAASVALIIGMYVVFNKSEKPNRNILVNTGIKDTNNVASHVVKVVDTTGIIQKHTPHTLDKNVVNNNPHILKIQRGKKNKNGISIPNNQSKDSSDVAVNKGKNDNHIIPVKEQTPLPDNFHSRSDSVAFNENTPDTTLGQPLIIMDNPYSAVAAAPRKRKVNFFISLVTLACKGLHKITGKHIELEKHFASDTTTIMAYQLDFGNRRFEFPVKD